MNTTALREYKASLTMSERQRQILIGTLLGDAHLERQRGSLVARLKIEHSLSQSTYVYWKFSEWRGWVRTPPKVRSKRNRLGSESENIGFSTLGHPELEKYRMWIYRDRRKTVPADLRLSPLTVAVWFMDDGSRKSSQCRGLVLNTQSYASEEVNLLRALLRRDVGIETSARKQSDGLQIYVPSTSVGTFVGFIDRHILPCMRYKLPG